MSEDTKQCPQCGGTGEIPHDRTGSWLCSRCDGTGRVPLTDKDREQQGQLNALEDGK